MILNQFKLGLQPRILRNRTLPLGWHIMTKLVYSNNSQLQKIYRTRDWPRLACQCPGVWWRYRLTMACCRVRGTEYHSVCPRHLKEITVIFITTTKFALRSNNGEGIQPPPINKVGLDLLNTAPPIRTRPSSPQSQFLPLGSFHKLLIYQRADWMKTTITENYSNWSHGPQPCLTQWNYEPSHVGPPKIDGSWWRVLTKHGPWEKGMTNHFSILILRTLWTVWKGKKIGHWKMNSPGW